MKNFISLLIITFSLLIISNVGSKASCPTGYSTKVVTGMYQGCTYKFEVCYKCDPTAPGPVILFDETFERIFSCPNPPDWDDVINHFREYVSSAQFVFNELCLWNDPDERCDGDPANWTTITMQFRYCFEEYDGPDKVRPCNFNDYCEVTYKYCLNPGNSQSPIARILGSATPVGTIPTLEDCPVFGNHDDGCFMVNTICNP